MHQMHMQQQAQMQMGGYPNQQQLMQQSGYPMGMPQQVTGVSLS
jgi:hypothetical protein